MTEGNPSERGPILLCVAQSGDTIRGVRQTRGVRSTRRTLVVPARRRSYMPAAGVGAVAAAWLAIAAIEAVQPPPIGSDLPSGALVLAGLNGVAALTLLPFRAWFRTVGVVVSLVVAVFTCFGLLAGDNTALGQG